MRVNAYPFILWDSVLGLERNEQTKEKIQQKLEYIDSERSEEIVFWQYHSSVLFLPWELCLLLWLHLQFFIYDSPLVHFVFLYVYIYNMHTFHNNIDTHHRSTCIVNISTFMLGNYFLSEIVSPGYKVPLCSIGASFMLHILF